MPAITSRHRWTSPSPPQAKIRSAPSSSARSTCFGALRLFGTSGQSGLGTPRSLERAPEARQPVAEGLARRARRPRPFIDPRRLCVSAAIPAARQHEDERSERGDADDHTAEESSGWCMPRYMRAKAT